jgi:hypothetical protein
VGERMVEERQSIGVTQEMRLLRRGERQGRGGVEVLAEYGEDRVHGNSSAVISHSMTCRHPSRSSKTI